jgi:glycosyltransferase involved in cell wall biosynthesis
MKASDLLQYKKEFENRGVTLPLSTVPISTQGLLQELPPPPKDKSGWPWTEEVDPNCYDQQQKWPKLSIITPSFNQGQFIEETIRSVLLQNYPNLEYVIIDGASSDDSLAIIQKYQPWLSYYTSEKDRGQAHAINRGLSILTGKYWQWINSDDYYMKDAFVKAIEVLECSKCDTLYGGVFESTDDKNLAYYRFSFNISKESIINPTSKFNTDFYYKPEATILSVNISQMLHGVREDFCNMFDTDFMIKYSQYANPIYTELILVNYRIHPLTKTIANSENIYKEYFVMLKEQKFPVGSKYWFGLLLKEASFMSTKDQSYCTSTYELMILAVRLLFCSPYVIISRAYWGIWRKILHQLIASVSLKSS